MLGELAQIPVRQSAQTNHPPALTLTAHQQGDGHLLTISVNQTAATSLGEITIPGQLDPFADGEVLLEILVWAASAPRAHLILVIGGHGGAGATTVATALAHAASARHRPREVCLVDCDFLSGAPIGGIHLDPAALTWSEVLSESGVLLADRVKELLGTWQTMTVLPVTPEVHPLGGQPEIDQRIIGAIRALAATHVVAVIDLPRFALLSSWGQQLCRHAHAIIWVVRGDAPSIADLAAARSHMPGEPARTTCVVTRRRASRPALAELCQTSAIFALEHDKSLAKAQRHGWAAGEAKRSPVTRLAVRLWTHLSERLAS